MVKISLNLCRSKTCHISPVRDEWTARDLHLWLSGLSGYLLNLHNVLNMASIILVVSLIISKPVLRGP